MLTFIPPYCGEEVKSNAEKKVFEILKNLDIKQGFVLHSLGLPKHQSKIYGEIDFVVVCERGVACLEIKGGRVECRDGRWYFTDRYGVEREKPEGPFAQVIGNMFSLKKVLAEHFKQQPGMKDILLASGVMFPDIEFQSRSQEIIPEMIYDRTTEDITAYLNGVFDYWQGRQHKEPRRLSPKNIQDVAAYLRCDFTYVPSLGDRLDEVEKKLLRLTHEQSVVLDALSMNEHLLIEGGAGTGKTLLAMEYARQRCEKGERVLYLTYNKNLAHDIIRRFQGQYSETLQVINIHALFGQYVDIDLDAMKQDPNAYFTEELPEEFLSYLEGLAADELAALQYDVLVMDEGQDILKPNYMFSLDRLLKGGLDKGRWAVFYDEKQNIYNPEFSDGLEFLTSYSNTRFRLFINCRNTIQIGTYNARVSQTELGEFLKENGEEVQVVSYESDEDFGDKISEVIKGLKKEKVPLHEVVLLSPKRYKNSKLFSCAGKRVAVNELTDDFAVKGNVPVYSTIQGFKGLDAKVVVLLDLDKIPGKMYSRYIYTACSRARSLLVVMNKS